MVAPRTDMHRLQELVRLHRMGTGVRERSRLLKMSTRTERAYREALHTAGLLDGEADQLPELVVLREAVTAAMPPPKPRAVKSTADRWMGEIREAVEKKVGPQALWDRLHREQEDFDTSLSALKRAYARVRKERGVQAEDVAIPVDTDPGDVAQVDFGYIGKLFDVATGKVRKAWAFVMVLGFSRHMFAKVVFDQKATTWVGLHIEAFRWFGGAPRTLVPDNLKAAVVRAAFGSADRHLLALNRTYRELARHYGFKIDPTPTYAPKKKGKVESGVKYLKGNFIKAGDFETIEEVSVALPQWLNETAGKRIHGTTLRRPLDLFEQERSELLPLPTAPYETVLWKQATVHADCHVEFDRRLYSVPWRTMGKQVWIRATPSSVYVFFDDVRIATHPRRGPERRSTNDAHLPEQRADLRHRSTDYWIKRAKRLGEPVHSYVQEVFDSDDVLSKLRDVQAIVTYLEGFPIHRAQAACERASFYANYSYQGLKRILVRGLDMQPLPNVIVPGHGQLEAPRFARSAAELLSPTQEVPHERH